jgi:hypothetical protein
MVFAELESYVRSTGLSVQDHTPNGEAGEVWMVVGGILLAVGPHEGTECEVAIRRSDQVPWAPDTKIHVRPHLAVMGQHSSQASEVGADWQYLSRRFDGVPTPAAYMAFIRSALEEL